MVVLFFRSATKFGAFLINIFIWSTIGGIAIQIKRVRKTNTLITTADTAAPRFRPRRWKNRTEGFNPAAKKRDITIKINTWLIDANARSRVIEMIAPAAAKNPK